MVRGRDEGGRAILRDQGSRQASSADVGASGILHCLVISLPAGGEAAVPMATEVAIPSN